MNERDAFAAYHPVVNMLYFALVLLFSMFLMHPACLFISLAGALSYLVHLGGTRRVLWLLLPLVLLTALINPVFNHQGATILAYLPSGNPLTMESIIYGVAAALMLCAVVLWFGCYTSVLSSDKFVYLFGRVIPALSLVLSMTLRFVPKFAAQARVISAAQRCVQRDASSGSLLRRTRRGLTILSILITWSLENAIETADSMKSRGYGLPGRSAFAIYRWQGRDTAALLWLLFCAMFVGGGAIAGVLHWDYFPLLGSMSGGALSVSFILCYLALCFTPLVIDLREERQWRALNCDN